MSFPKHPEKSCQADCPKVGVKTAVKIETATNSQKDLWGNRETLLWFFPIDVFHPQKNRMESPVVGEWAG